MYGAVPTHPSIWQCATRKRINPKEFQFEFNSLRRGTMEDQFNKINNPSGAGTAARMKETVSDKASEAKDKVVQYGRQAVDKLDAQRFPAANALEQTASVLHENSDKAASVSHRAADKIQATAEYIRQHDLKAMGEDV